MPFICLDIFWARPSAAPTVELSMGSLRSVSPRLLADSRPSHSHLSRDSELLVFMSNKIFS